MPPSPTSSQKGMELCRSVLSPGSMLAMGCSLPSCVPSFEGAATWRDYCTACERETRVRMVTSEIVRVGQHGAEWENLPLCLSCATLEGLV